MSSNNKEDSLLIFRDLYFLTKEIKLSSIGLRNLPKLIEEIKTLKVIEIDDFESVSSYINYDHYLIFKKDGDYYFCDTEFIPALNKDCLIKLLDFNYYLRKDKIKKIDESSTN